jgi:hypothetical protein
MIICDPMSREIQPVERSRHRVVTSNFMPGTLTRGNFSLSGTAKVSIAYYGSSATFVAFAALIQSISEFDVAINLLSSARPFGSASAVQSVAESDATAALVSWHNVIQSVDVADATHGRAASEILSDSNRNQVPTRNFSSSRTLVSSIGSCNAPGHLG